MYQTTMYSPKKVAFFTANILVVSLALGSLIIFRPYSFVDNDKAKVICVESGASFDIGPNFIYTLEDKLDSFNDQKARKLCQYNIIRDYGNTYQTPDKVNYQFKPVYTKDSSWGDAILIALTILSLGILLVKLSKYTLNLRNTIFILILGIVLFFLFIKKPANIIFCQRQIAQKVVNFKNSAFKGGVIPIPEDDQHIKSIIKPLYEKCLQGRWFFSTSLFYQ